MEKILFTSESVTEGHPDKMCDAISDAILDALMEKDPMSRVACETATTTGLVLVMGEITTNAYVDIQKIVRDTIREIGYTRGKYGFDADTCAVITAIDEQSADIALGVDKALEAKMGEDEIDAIGAGDQGIQFGYASNETEEYMPYAINMAHKLARQLTKIRKRGSIQHVEKECFSSIVVSGIQLITKWPVTPRNVTIVSVALGLGYGLGANSAVLAHMPQAITLIFGGSGIVPAALFAIILNIVLPPDEKSEVEIAEEILDMKRKETQKK